MRSKAKRSAGFTLVEIMIVVMIIAIITSIAVPNFLTARNTTRRSACIHNLKYIDTRKELFAMEARLNTGDTVAWTDLVPAYMKFQPDCPGGGTYTMNVIGTNPVCTLSGSGHAIP
jgi:prepilin-type N-terminal cleavage/methylation domain-containing protein